MPPVLRPRSSCISGLAAKRPDLLLPTRPSFLQLCPSPHHPPDLSRSSSQPSAAVTPFPSPKQSLPSPVYFYLGLSLRAVAALANEAARGALGGQRRSANEREGGK